MKKVGVILAIFFSFFLGFSFVSAGEVSCESGNNCIELADKITSSFVENMDNYNSSGSITDNDMQYYVLLKRSNDTQVVQVVWSTAPLIYNTNDGYLYITGDTKLVHYILNVDDQGKYTFKKWAQIYDMHYSPNPSNCVVNSFRYDLGLVSNYDVKDQNGDFFLNPPTQYFPGVTEGILQQVKTGMIGLIPLLAGLVVLLVAFWKGYKMLLKVLRQA